MVSHDKIETCLKQDKSVQHVHVSGDGYHYELLVVSDEFKGMRPVKRQQWVYAKLNQYITSGDLHALTMKSFTKAEWESSRE